MKIGFHHEMLDLHEDVLLSLQFCAYVRFIGRRAISIIFLIRLNSTETTSASFSVNTFQGLDVRIKTFGTHETSMSDTDKGTHEFY